MGDNVGAKWLVIGSVALIDVGSHIWMLWKGLPADMMMAHAWSNLIVAGIVLAVIGYELWEDS